MSTAAAADALVEVRDLTTMLNGKTVFDRPQISTFRAARSPPSWVPAVPARPPCSSTSPGRCAPTAATCAWTARTCRRWAARLCIELRERIGYLFQNSALLTDYDVFENVAFPLRQHARLPEVLMRNIVLTKLQAVGLRGAARLMPSELSGGMARRVALARAIVFDPMLILYDEPFVGLDPIALEPGAQADPHAQPARWASPRSWSRTSSRRCARSPITST